jgi:hypothetical protein
MDSFYLFRYIFVCLINLFEIFLLVGNIIATGFVSVFKFNSVLSS